MRRIGIIGGMSWESTLEYYRLINQFTRGALGGLHSADMIIYSYNFQEIEKMQHLGQWDEMTKSMITIAQQLETAGAKFIVIATNTMHKLVPAIEREIGIPILHIADATAEAIKAQHLKKVGLLGTRFTMEGDFYRDRLTGVHEIEVIIPDEQARELIHRIIYSELCLGVIDSASRLAFVRVIEDLVRQGAEGIILGCTEIPLLVKAGDVSVPVFDTTAIHAEAAVKMAVGSGL